MDKNEREEPKPKEEKAELSQTVENAHATGDGALAKNDDRPADEQVTEPKQPPPY